MNQQQQNNRLKMDSSASHHETLQLRGLIKGYFGPHRFFYACFCKIENFHVKFLLYFAVNCVQWKIIKCEIFSKFVLLYWTIIVNSIASVTAHKTLFLVNWPNIYTKKVIFLSVQPLHKSHFRIQSVAWTCWKIRDQLCQKYLWYID